MNYAEKMTYWYLRLNGFFPLANFVLHREGSRGGADSDVIAIRMKHTDERIGGAADVDPILLERIFGINRIQDYRLGLICEVKAGARIDASQLPSITQSRRISMAVQRMGLLAPELAEKAIDKITAQGIWTGKQTAIATVLVASSSARSNEYLSHKQISLTEMDRFILNRMNQYTEKVSDWTYFQDDFLEYMIWRSKQGIL